MDTLGPDNLTNAFKKCPECLASLALNAEECTECKQKVGPPDHRGLAKKPTNWKGYIYTIIAWSALAIFVWYGFFR